MAARCVPERNHRETSLIILRLIFVHDSRCLANRFPDGPSNTVAVVGKWNVDIGYTLYPAVSIYPIKG
jgi:hypothetical protein